MLLMLVDGASGHGAAMLRIGDVTLESGSALVSRGKGIVRASTRSATTR